MSDWQPPSRGALDDTKWPEHLVARAVDVTQNRVHGYEVVADIARHYRHSDLSYLAITGELPDDRASSLFHLGLCTVTAVGVNEAPSHIGVLSRSCGGTLASAIGSASIALADEAHHVVEAHATFLQWLAARTGPAPTGPVPARDHWYDVLIETLAALGLQVPWLSSQLSESAIALGLFHEAGLSRTEQLEAALVLARMGGVLAEILITGPQHLREYPVTLPPFHYVGGAR